MISEETVKTTWLKLKGTSETVSLNSVESPITIFLDGSIYINPDNIDEIENIIKSFKLKRNME
jgi:predicted glycosyltransferase involved in capsule biosynthesis